MCHAALKLRCQKVSGEDETSIVDTESVQELDC